MTISTSRLSYLDCFEIFDRAIDDPQGLRIRLDSINDATFLRMRMHTARKLDRKRNEEIYEPGEPMHGCSVYDKLILRIRQHPDGAYLYVQQISIHLGEIELLSEALPLPDAPAELEHTEPLQITDESGFKRRF